MLKTLKKSEAILIALITAILYSGSYFYERGSAVYYGIPTDLISISPASITIMVITVFTFITYVYFFSSFIIIVATRKTQNRFLLLYSIFSPVIIFWIGITFLNGELTWRNAIKSEIFHIVLTLILLMGSKHPQRKGSLDVEQNSSKHNNNSIFTNIDNTAAIIFFLALAFSLATHGLGKYIANISDKYDGFTIKNEHYAIVKIYGDNFIVKKISDGKLTHGIQIFDKADLKNITIEKVSLNGTPNKNEA